MIICSCYVTMAAIINYYSKDNVYLKLQIVCIGDEAFYAAFIFEKNLYKSPFHCPENAKNEKGHGVTKV